MNKRIIVMLVTIALILSTFSFADSNKELSVNITDSNARVDNSSFDLYVAWEISDDDVSVGDYFYMTLPNLIDYSGIRQIGNGVIGTHMGNGEFRFVITEQYNNHMNISGDFSINRTLSKAVAKELSKVSININSQEVDIPVDNEIDDRPSNGIVPPFQKMGYPIREKDGQYYIDWVILVGSNEERYYNTTLTDILGDGLVLVEDSFKVRGLNIYGEKMEVFIDEPIISDMGFSIFIKDTATYYGNARVEITYRTILDKNLDQYHNTAYIENESMEEIITWGIDSSDNGVIRPPIKEEQPMIPLEPSKPIEKEEDVPVVDEEPEKEIPLTPLEPSRPVEKEDEGNSIPLIPLEPSKPIEEELEEEIIIPNIKVEDEEIIEEELEEEIVEEEELEEEVVEDNIEDIEIIEDIAEEVLDNQIEEIERLPKTGDNSMKYNKFGISLMLLGLLLYYYQKLN